MVVAPSLGAMSPHRYKARPLTKAIIIHDSHTPPSVTAGEVWLRVNGRELGLLDIGYHFIIERDGALVECTPHGLMGAHCTGRNYDTIGVCLMGGVEYEPGEDEPVSIATDNFTADQLLTLRHLIVSLRAVYGSELPVLGHSEAVRFHDPQHVCPALDMNELRASLGR